MDKRGIANVIYAVSVEDANPIFISPAMQHSTAAAILAFRAHGSSFRNQIHP
jgi:hypothetical protein